VFGADSARFWLWLLSCRGTARFGAVVVPGSDGCSLEAGLAAVPVLSASGAGDTSVLLEDSWFIGRC